MRLGIRVKLFAAVFALIVLVIGITGGGLYVYLKTYLVDRIEHELMRHARMAGIVLSTQPPAVAEWPEADVLADRIGQAVDARVTIVRGGGEVVGDSKIDRAAVRRMENHRDRIEIRQALETGAGRTVRYSTTLDVDMLYVAAAFNTGAVRGVVRVSRPLVEVAEAAADLRHTLLVACLIGLVLAALMTGVASHLFARRLQTVVDFASELVSGERRGKVHDSSRDEIAGLAGSLNALASKLEEHVTTLAEQRNQFEVVLDGMSEAVIALDKDNHVTLINRAGTMLLGITGQPTGRRLMESVRAPALYEIATSAESGGDKTAEFDIQGEKPRRIYARATRLQTGGVVIVLQDVTELRRLESMRRDFVSNVSHELRTPITIIQANAETLRDGAIEDPEAAARFLSSMIDNTDRLSNLIADLLDITRIEEGKYDLDLVPVSLGLALTRAAAALETKAIERDLSIKVAEVGGLRVEADTRALDQILFNLLDNAVKYSGQGGSVVLRAQEKDGRVRIEVEDNGPGIEPKYRDRLFERFFRVDRGRSREMGGTGLGLAIVKHLVSAMNGRVGMAPASPNGSIFWFSLRGA
jgi:two-component system, OmpR family, phosphate regulon sensor histidine kinase PhoR